MEGASADILGCMFTKKMNLSRINSFFSLPGFWFIILIKCFITWKNIYLLKFHHRVLVSKAYIFAINWNQMLIVKSVPDSITAVECKTDKWQNCQWFTNHCNSCPLLWRTAGICSVFCCVSESVVRQGLSLCMLLGPCPVPAAARLGTKMLGKHSTKITRNVFLEAVL